MEGVQGEEGVDAEVVGAAEEDSKWLMGAVVG